MDAMTTGKAGRKAAVAELFETKALAIIGASPEASKLGSAPMTAMRNLGYVGKIYGVHPRHEEVLGYPCVKSIADLPDEVTAAMVLVNAELATSAVEECGARGIRSIVLIPQGFGEAGGEGLARDARIRAAADTYDMAICGPNTNGISNVANGMAMSLGPVFTMPGKVSPGRVSIVSQSGAMVSNIVSKLSVRGIGIAKTATCGNELILTMADYLDYMAGDPATDAVVLLVETIRDRDGLAQAIRRCRENGKPVIAVKSGQSDIGKKATLSHTGAIAGSFANTVAFLKAQGAMVAGDIEVMAAMTECLTRYRWPLETPQRVGMVSISGGFAALAADEMARIGLPLGTLSEKAVAELEALPNQSHAINPYDFAAQNGIISDVLEIFRRDGFNQMIFGLSLLKDGIREIVQQKILDAKAAGYDQIYVISPETPPGEKAHFQSQGISVSEDTRPLFEALRDLGTFDLAERAEAGAAPALPDMGFAGKAGLLNEDDSKAAIGRLGVASPQRRVVGLVPDLGAIDGLKRPVVIKGLSDRIAHKTEHGIVALNLGSDAEIAGAWATVAANLGKADPEAGSLLVEEMVAPGLEAIVGIQNDEAVGPVVVAGAGGILVELIDSAVVLVPPFDAAGVERALEGTAFGRLLNGYRGKSYDKAAFVDTVVRLGQLALAEPRLDSVDVNPLIVNERGVVAVDAKITLADG